MFENDQLVKEIGYYENGQKRYEKHILNDKLHREDGPAIQRWFDNGQKDYEYYKMINYIEKMDQLVKVGLKMVRKCMKFII